MQETAGTFGFITVKSASDRLFIYWVFTCNCCRRNAVYRTIDVTQAKFTVIIFNHAAVNKTRLNTPQQPNLLYVLTKNFQADSTSLYIRKIVTEYTFVS